MVCQAITSRLSLSLIQAFMFVLVMLFSLSLLADSTRGAYSANNANSANNPDLETQYLCQSHHAKNIQVAVNLSSKSVRLYTRFNDSTPFVNNGKFVCRDSRDVKINPSRSEIFVCGDHPVDTSETIMGHPVFEVPHLQISSGFGYRVTFLRKNYFSHTVILEVAQNSQQNYSISLNCSKQ